MSTHERNAMHLILGLLLLQQTFHATVDTRLIINGPHTISVVAYDKDGNVVGKDSITVIVNNPRRDDLPPVFRSFR